MSKQILMVLTSHDRLGQTGRKTGLWLEEFTAPYYAFVDAGYEVTVGSPKGGPPPVDPKSDQPDSQTRSTTRFSADRDAQERLAASTKLSALAAEPFDALFYPGGHGPLWDLPDNTESIGLIEAFWALDKPVSAVCHGSAALINARDRTGTLIVKGRRVTGFSNSEEEAVALTDIVPLLVESELTKRGGDYSKAGDFEAHVAIDGGLITGQNPASSEAVARAVLQRLA